MAHRVKDVDIRLASIGALPKSSSDASMHDVSSQKKTATTALSYAALRVTHIQVSRGGPSPESSARTKFVVRLDVQAVNDLREQLTCMS